MTLELDHIAVVAPDLEAGVAGIETLVGLPMAAGGRHDLMGTHNRLLSLGPGLYLEVIAIDPAATPPGRARWFDMDRLSGPARLANWICRSSALAADMAAMPPGIGRPIPAARGTLRWTMVVPDDGILPLDGACPALIEWAGTDHPSAHLPDHGLRLKMLEICHPEAAALQQCLAPMLKDDRLHFRSAPQPALAAWLSGPGGPVVLR